MKQQLFALAMGSVLVTLTSAAHAVTLYDYSQPTSAYEDAYVSGSLNVNDGNQDQTSHNLNVNADYERVFSSASRDVKVDATASGSSTRGGNKGDDTIENYLGNGSVSVNNYLQPNSRGAFWYGDSSVGVKKGADDPRVKVGVGVGYGRVVNVTPMARAIRLVEALQMKNRISGELNAAEYNQIAQIIAKESEYRSRHGYADYEQFWITDIEKAISATGKSSGALGAAGILKARDVLVNERISTRKHGWLVKAGVGAVVQDYDGESGKPSLDLGAEYHVPLSNRTQFSNEASASAVLKDSDNSYTARNGMKLTHEVTDRVDWINAWDVDYNHNDKTDSDVTTHEASSTYRYYVTNKMAFDTKLAASKVNDGVSGNGNDKTDTSLFMGVNYRLK